MTEVDQWARFLRHLECDYEKKAPPVPFDKRTHLAVKLFKLEPELWGKATDQKQPVKEDIEWLKATAGQVDTLNKTVKSFSLKGWQGWYGEEKGLVIKELDWGHKFSDMFEAGAQITEDMVSYDRPYELMTLLPNLEDDGPLIGLNGYPLTEGSYMFTVGKDMRLRYFPTDNMVCEKGDTTKHFVQYLPHAVLAKRESVYAAGNFGILDGKLEWVASTSGHYRVNDKMCCENFAAALEWSGYEFDRSTFLSYEEAKELFKKKKPGKNILVEVRPPATQLTDLIEDTLVIMDQIKNKQPLSRPSRKRQTQGMRLLQEQQVKVKQKTE